MNPNLLRWSFAEGNRERRRVGIAHRRLRRRAAALAACLLDVAALAYAGRPDHVAGKPQRAVSPLAQGCPVAAQPAQ